MTTPAPKQITELLNRSEFASAAYHAAARIALEIAAELAERATVHRADIAEALCRFAVIVVPNFDDLPELGGLERRTVVLWSSRVLVEACYANLPRGPVLFTIESYLGGTIRRTIANFLGERVSAWLDGFIELEVAKLRKAAAK